MDAYKQDVYQSPESPPGTMRDYSKPLTIDRRTQHLNKTVDIGCNGVTLSTDALGSILQLGTYHPEHGIIVATTYEQFDESGFNRPQYVREYRSRMLKLLEAGASGYGLRFLPDQESTCQKVTIEIVSKSQAVFKFALADEIRVCLTTTVHENGSVSQRACISNNSGTEFKVSYELDLGISVHRASYAQLTEGGPVALPQSQNRLQVEEDGGLFKVWNEFVDSYLAGIVEVNGERISFRDIPDTVAKGRPLNCSKAGQVVIPPSASADVTATFVLVQSRDPKTLPQGHHAVNGHGVSSNACWKHTDQLATYIVRRNVDYILGNCAIPFGADEVAIMTDHVALPLGWNRDNYWQWKLLLVMRRDLDRFLTPHGARQYAADIDRTIKGHLSWVFKRAQRPNGFWHRSYIVTGSPKDGRTFQLDQQCYPLLELCDFLNEFPDEAAFVKSLIAEPAISDILQILVAKRDTSTGLVPTDETPGDDSVEHPYHFSSHVLLWHTLVELANLFEAVGAPPRFTVGEVRCLAQQVRSATLQHFLVTDQMTGSTTWAYLTDGHTEYKLYHDANDIPTVLAAQWRFLSSADELAAWHNTMLSATSPQNTLGYSAGGPFAGLGSVHSEGAWPLGYFQELVYATVTGNKAAQRDAWRRIVGAMQWDGTFGEAVDVKTGATTSKAWFSWPGSMLAAALVDGTVAAPETGTGPALEI